MSSSSASEGKSIFPEQHSFKASDMNSTFTIDTRFTYIKTLGSGAYGVVIAANDSRGRRIVAIKKIAHAFENACDGLRMIREIKLLQHFNHPNIVKMIDLLNPPLGIKLDDMYIVQDLMDSDLRKVIVSKQSLSEDHTRFFIYQLLLAIKHIHSAGVIHRDLKPGNLLINANCHLKVCDFGLARGCGKTADFADAMTEYVVTRWYRAPEVLCSCKRYGFEVDMWSIGCIMAELFARKPLFPGENSSHQIKLIVATLGITSDEDLSWMDNAQAVAHMHSLGVVPKIPFAKKFTNASKNALDLLTRMLQLNPVKRISVADALQHPFFSEFHCTETVPDSKVLFDFEFDNIQFSKQSLQDFAWEEIYKFRPLLRPLGPNLTVKHYDVMRARMARKKKAREEKYTLHMAAGKLGEIRLPPLVNIHPMPMPMPMPKPIIAPVVGTTQPAPHALPEFEKGCAQRLPTDNISSVGAGPEKVCHWREDDEVAAVNLARLSN